MAHATIRDVAREAEVSVASVSRVLNGNPGVRPTLRIRVEQAVAALGYVPHLGARSLSAGRSGAIGVVLPDLHGEFFSELLRGLDRAASGRGWQLLLSNIHADGDRALAALDTMRGRVDGLIVMAPHLDADRLIERLPASLPAVLLNVAAHRRRATEFRVDSRAGAIAMVEHLIAGGRTRIAHLSGPGGNVDADARRDGYLAALAGAGLPARIIPGDFSEEAGRRGAALLAADRDGCDALFAANDMMAIGALVGLREAGLDVPGDVALGGFDDIPVARLVSPALTTMRVDMDALGSRLVDRLAERMDALEAPACEAVVPTLVVRDTTGSTNNNNNRAHPENREDAK